MSEPRQIDLPLNDNAIDPIERLQRDMQFLTATATVILDSLPIQRRPLSDATKLLHCKVTWTRRNGLCACCQRQPVCTAEGKLPGAEFDHWYARHRNGPEESWLVCAPCNRSLEATHYKAAVRSAFEAYQLALRPFLATGQEEMFG
ncbi:MAG TPA: hypothetical protein VKR43_09230 [Bryobacteraceae bacterium]|nr:hypothetical protein [Bryobacteraceae bacterium]